MLLLLLVVVVVVVVVVILLLINEATLWNIPNGNIRTMSKNRN